MKPPSTDPLAAVSWQVVGKVCIDSATVVLGDPDAFISWRASGAWPPGNDVLDQKLAFMTLDGDWDCPVEKGMLGSEVVAVRVEFDPDVADTAGSWDAEGELVLNTPWCVVLDPMCKVPEQSQEWLFPAPTGDVDLLSERGFVVGSTLGVPTGRYCVEVFNSPGREPMGVRLRLLTPVSPPPATATAQR